MKKLFSILSALTLAVSLTVCNDNASPERFASTDFFDNSSVSTSSESSSISSFSESSTASILPEPPNESENDPDTKTLIENFPLEIFNLPDGSTISKYEACDANGEYALGFDFSFLRYAQPLFHNTIDEPEMFDWENGRMQEGLIDYSTIRNPNYTKVANGDILINGLIVKSASSYFNPISVVYESEIELDGELTLSGIMHCASEDDYRVHQGDLYFWGDPTQYKYIPVSVRSASEGVGDFWYDFKEQFAIVGEETRIKLGSVDKISVDLSGVITRGEYIKAKIIIKDLVLTYSQTFGFQIKATLVSAEKL